MVRTHCLLKDMSYMIFCALTTQWTLIIRSCKTSSSTARWCSEQQYSLFWPLCSHLIQTMPHLRKANVQFRHSGKWYCVDGLVFHDAVPFLWNIRTHKPSNTASHTRRHESSTKLLWKPCITQSTSSRSRSPLSTETTCNFGFLFHILEGRYLIQL